jgi:hypothetical protein
MTSEFGDNSLGPEYGLLMAPAPYLFSPLILSSLLLVLQRTNTTSKCVVTFYPDLVICFSVEMNPHSDMKKTSE